MNHSKKRSLMAWSSLVLALVSSVALTGCSTAESNPGSPSATSSAVPSSDQPDQSDQPIQSDPSAAPGSQTSSPGTLEPSQAAGLAPSMPKRLLPIPAPSGGTINEVIPKGTPGPVTKVGMEDTAALPNKVAIEISEVESIETKATTPGEIAGPAVAMHVSIHNGSANKININSVIVTLKDSKSGLGQPTTSDPYSPFAGDLAAGDSAKAVYVFLVPKDDRQALTLSVEYAAGRAGANFTGDVP